MHTQIYKTYVYPADDIQDKTDRQTGRQTDRQADRQADRHAGKQTDRLTDRPTQIHECVYNKQHTHNDHFQSTPMHA